MCMTDIGILLKLKNLISLRNDDERRISLGVETVITVVEGDLLNATEDIIGHQVNCQSVMGSGVAKVVRDRYPIVYSEYISLSEKHHPVELLGRCQVVNTKENKFVANLFGQLNYGYDGRQYTNYDALRNALRELSEYAKTNDLSVALPYKIGSDRGGADWNEVQKIIEEEFDEVTLYKL